MAKKKKLEQKESVTLFSRHVEILKPYREHLPHPISNPYVYTALLLMNFPLSIALQCLLDQSD